MQRLIRDVAARNGLDIAETNLQRNRHGVVPTGKGSKYIDLMADTGGGGMYGMGHLDKSVFDLINWKGLAGPVRKDIRVAPGGYGVSPPFSGS
jgi:hypothetical protein